MYVPILLLPFLIVEPILSLFWPFPMVYEGRNAGFCALCAIQKHVSRALQSTGRTIEPKDLVYNLRRILERDILIICLRDKEYDCWFVDFDFERTLHLSMAFTWVLVTNYLFIYKKSWISFDSFMGHKWEDVVWSCTVFTYY